MANAQQGCGHRQCSHDFNNALNTKHKTTKQNSYLSTEPDDTLPVTYKNIKTKGKVLAGGLLEKNRTKYLSYTANTQGLRASFGYHQKLPFSNNSGYPQNYWQRTKNPHALQYSMNKYSLLLFDSESTYFNRISFFM